MFYYRLKYQVEEVLSHLHVLEEGLLPLIPRMVCLYKTILFYFIFHFQISFFLFCCILDYLENNIKDSQYSQVYTSHMNKVTLTMLSWYIIVSSRVQSQVCKIIEMKHPSGARISWEQNQALVNQIIFFVCYKPDSLVSHIFHLTELIYPLVSLLNFICWDPCISLSYSLK